MLSLRTWVIGSATGNWGLWHYFNDYAIVGQIWVRRTWDGKYNITASVSADDMNTELNEGKNSTRLGTVWFSSPTDVPETYWDGPKLPLPGNRWIEMVIGVSK